MAIYRKNAPIGHTCPNINQVISFLEKIDWDLSNMRDEIKDLKALEITKN